jgi:hypothetical protein
MGISNAMRTSPVKGEDQAKAYLSERSYRLGRLTEKWSRVPEVGDGLKQLSEGVAGNVAVLLENQARLMSRLSEAQLSSSFQGLKY